MEYRQVVKPKTAHFFFRYFDRKLDKRDTTVFADEIMEEPEYYETVQSDFTQARSQQGEDRVDALVEWMEDNVTHRGWEKAKRAVRQKRYQDKNDVKQVAVHHDTWKHLKQLSSEWETTMNETIQRLLDAQTEPTPSTS